MDSYSKKELKNDIDIDVVHRYFNWDVNVVYRVCKFCLIICEIILHPMATLIRTVIKSITYIAAVKYIRSFRSRKLQLIIFTEKIKNMPGLFPDFTLNCSVRTG